MKKILSFFALSAAMLVVLSCNKMEPSVVATEPDVTESIPMTRAIGDKDLIMTVYVETNDVNPLNAMDYILDGDMTFFDIVELFASNIRKTTVSGATQPTLYLNDKLAPVLEGNGVNTYVRPLQNEGMKVLLTVLGDWQGIGVANMNTTQQKQFANILAWAVQKYGLDGIGFDDEYADYSTALVSGSYSNIITYTRELIGNDKIITVFDWGNTNMISSAATAEVDYIYHGYFGSYLSKSWCRMPGVTNSQWFPLSLNLANSYNANTIEGYAEDAVNDGYAGIMCFNLRTKAEKDPTPVLQAISDGAFGGMTVTCTNGNRSRDAGSDPDGCTLTNAEAKAGLAAAGKTYYNL